jgi:cell wall-associated NlpC family hydrolase
MPTRQQIIDEARTWLGTPFRHQGRLKGVGVDCGGLIVCVRKDLGISEWDYTTYSRQPQPKVMVKYLKEFGNPVKKSEMQPADVIWMKVEGNPQHLGIYTEKNTVIHARWDMDFKKSRVIESIIDETLASSIMAVYRMPEVTE